jgi:cobaltochelatase CobS
MQPVMKRQELVTHAANRLQVNRGVMMSATGTSMLKALDKLDEGASLTAARSYLLKNDGTPLLSLTGTPTASETPTEPQKVTTPPPSGDLAAMLASAIQPYVKANTDELMDLISELEAKVDDKLSNFKPATTTITIQNLETGDTKDLGRQHKTFETFLKLAAVARVARRGIYLKGPAGSGKTTAGEKVAEALSLPFYVQSMGPQTSQSQLLGYMDGHGNYVKGFLRQPFEHGGICMLDEIDNSNPSVLTILNSAMANGYCSFPDGMVKRHADCIFVASGNTFGTGADSQYVGRQQLDAATLDRFFVLDWPYDEDFEHDITVATYGDEKKVTDWIDYVRKVRNAVASLKIRFVVSPRATLGGVAMLKAGFTVDAVKDIALFTNMSTDDRAKVTANVR